MIAYTFHHDSVRSWQLWFTGFLHTTLSSPTLSSSCPPSTLLLTLVPTLFIVLLSTLCQHPHKPIHSTLSILFFLFSCPISVKKRSPLSAMKSLMVGVIATKSKFLLSQICPHIDNLYRSPFHIPLHLHYFPPSSSIRIAHYLGSSLALLSAYLRLISCSDYRAEGGHLHSHILKLYGILLFHGLAHLSIQQPAEFGFGFTSRSMDPHHTMTPTTASLFHPIILGSL